jgi:hypothetical protein
MGVQVVREHLEKEGRKLTSWHGYPDVDPSIWLQGDDGREWVVVRAVRYPVREAQPPDYWDEIARSCAHLGKRGHFASVSLASMEDPFDSSGKMPVVPLWRGHGIAARFTGLVRKT